MKLNVDLNRYIKLRESEYYTLYLEKEPLSEKTREAIIVYKKYDRAVRCLVSKSYKSLIKLLCAPVFEKELTEKQKRK